MKSKRIVDIPLPQASIGSKRHLRVVYYGEPGARPKVYIQTGLHADELPGLLVMHHLIRLLDDADAEGLIEGEIVLLPAVNPIGMSQHQFDSLQGRYENNSGLNFNRGFADLTGRVAEKIASGLSDNADENIAMIQSAALESLELLQPCTEMAFFQHALMQLAVDSDICLDLHCDYEALLYIFTGTPLWPEANDLSAQLGSHATLLALDSGGNSFDEAIAGLWWSLAERFPDYPIPPACLAATVELRGKHDVDDDTAVQDANNLFRFLQRRNVIQGDPGPLPALINEATPLEGVDEMKTPVAGIIVYHKELGEFVHKGEKIASIIDPYKSGDSARTPLYTVTDGLLFARRHERMAQPGQSIVNIAGKEPLAHRVGQYLLSD